jgi:hypothetical protein
VRAKTTPHPNQVEDKSVSLTAEQFRYSSGDAISEEESNQLYEK